MKDVSLISLINKQDSKWSFLFSFTQSSMMYGSLPQIAIIFFKKTQKTFIKKSVS